MTQNYELRTVDTMQLRLALLGFSGVLALSGCAPGNVVKPTADVEAAVLASRIKASLNNFDQEKHNSWAGFICNIVGSNISNEARTEIDDTFNVEPSHDDILNVAIGKVKSGICSPD